jgi:hypothetical protein
MWRLILASILFVNLAHADTYTDYGWNPGLVAHRIATASPSTKYFEACTDVSCTSLGAGEGFHSLIAGTGEGVVPDCQTNSGGSCPYFFVWDGNTAALGLSAVGPAQRPGINVYLGLQDNLKSAASPYKFGSFDHPPITSAALSELVSAQFVVGTQNGRVLSGIVFYADKAYVLEVNIDSVGSVPDWSTTTRIARKVCDATSCTIYLGGRAFGISSVLGTTRQRLLIDWGQIVRQLIASGDLPQVAQAALITDAWYTGQEVLGSMAVGVQIQDRHIYAVEHSPVGHLTFNKGWAVDPDKWNTPVTVKLYKDGPIGVGTPYVTVIAGDPTPVAPGYTGSHGFHYPPLPGHTLFAYAVDPVTNETKILPGSGLP